MAYKCPEHVFLHADHISKIYPGTKALDDVSLSLIHILIEIDQVKDYPDDKVVLITTGSQGESMAALSRMAANIHKKITIKPNDTIIFSSNPIPGNEKAVSKVINELYMKGAKVIFQDAHVSGHACQEEIKLI